MISVNRSSTSRCYIVIPHQRLIDYLNDEAWQRRMALSELSAKMGLNKSQLGAIVRGQQPGLKLCSDIAAYFKLPLTTVLAWAGHIEDEQDELRSAMLDEIETLMRKLPPDDQMDLLDLARAKLRRKEELP